MDRASDGGFYADLARRAAADRRRLAGAVLAAVTVHLLLLVLPAPRGELAATTSTVPSRPRLFQLQEVRFAPSPPPPVPAVAAAERPAAPAEEGSGRDAGEDVAPPSPPHAEFDLLLPDEANPRLLPPQPVTTVLPEAPEAVPESASVGGVVVLRVLLDGEGGVVEVNVLDGPPALAEAAAEAVRAWTFLPATLDGVATPVAVGVRFRFPA